MGRIRSPRLESFQSQSTRAKSRPVVPRKQQSIPPITAALFAASPQARPASDPVAPCASQDTGSSTNSTDLGHPSDRIQPMAIHVATRHMYPSLGAAYQTPQPESPGSGHQLQGYGGGDRGFYYGRSSLPQDFYGYPQYMISHHPSYAHHGYPGYTTVTAASNGMVFAAIPPNFAPPLDHRRHSSQSTSSGSLLNGTPGLKLEPLQEPMDLDSAIPLTSRQTNFSSGPRTVGGRSESNAAPPGPIRATPVILSQDESGVQWITFEYSRDRIKNKYSIRCNVESVDIGRLGHDFKTANCVYPRACSKESYRGNRLGYESECNTVGWALANLNPSLQGKRGLIQRAVDSWRNSHSDPKMRSRRVRRMIKNKARKMSNSQQYPVQTAIQVTASEHAATIQTPMHTPLHPPTQMRLTAGQPSEHLAAYEASSGHVVENTRAPFNETPSSPYSVLSGPSPFSSSFINHDRCPSSPLISPTDSFHSHQIYQFCSPNAQWSPAYEPSDAVDDLEFPVPEEHKTNADDEKRILFGHVPDTKQAKFILVEDCQRGTRVRVRVSLGGVKMEDMPESHLQTNSVFPRSYSPRCAVLPNGGMVDWREDMFEVENGNDEDREVGDGDRDHGASVQVPLLDGRLTDLAVPLLSKKRRATECLLNEVGYRMSWSQAKTFSGRTVFMQRSLDAYRNKMRSSLVAAGRDEPLVMDQFETRPGKRKWAQLYPSSRDPSP